MQALLGSVVTNNSMFLYSILGCDATSGVYGLGNKLSISKIKSDSQFQDQAKVFMSQGANTDGIISAGETALVCLYNGNPHHGINVLRYEKLCVKAQYQFNLLHFLLCRIQSNTTVLECTTRFRNG